MAAPATRPTLARVNWRSGRARLGEGGALGGCSCNRPSRLTGARHVPTANEAGLPGFELNIWSGLFAPKETAKPVVDKLSVSLQEAVNDPTVKAKLAELGAVPVSQERARPEPLRVQLKSEIDK